MGLPQKLKNGILTIDGYGYAGECNNFTPPKLTRKMEEHQGGGMLGPVSIDLGMEAMEASFTAKGFATTMLKHFARSTVGAMLIRYNAAFQRDDTGETGSIEIIVRGRIKELDLGDLTVGELNESKYTIPCSYLKIVVNGKTAVEIDLVNMLHIIDGIDLLADIRQALGMVGLSV